MAAKLTRVRVNRELADEAMRALGVRSGTEAVRVAVRWVLDLERSKELKESAAENRESCRRKTEVKG